MQHQFNIYVEDYELEVPGTNGTTAKLCTTISADVMVDVCPYDMAPTKAYLWQQTKYVPVTGWLSDLILERAEEAIVSMEGYQGFDPAREYGTYDARAL